MISRDNAVLNKTDGTGKSALYFAFLFEQEASWKLLIERGAQNIVLNWIFAHCSGKHLVWNYLTNTYHLRKDITDAFNYIKTYSLVRKLYYELNCFLPFCAGNFETDFLEKQFNCYADVNPLTYRIPIAENKKIFLGSYLKELNLKGIIHIQRREDALRFYDRNGNLLHSVEDEIKKTIVSQMGRKMNIHIDMDDVVGEGGEGYIVKYSGNFQNDKEPCCIKFVPYRIDKSTVDTKSPHELHGDVYEKNYLRHLEYSKEYSVGAIIDHKNIIRYLDFAISRLGNEYFHTIGRAYNFMFFTAGDFNEYF